MAWYILIHLIPSQIMAAAGSWYVFYFLAAIFFCSFYLLNLVLAVVALSYEQEMKFVHHEVKKLMDVNQSINQTNKQTNNQTNNLSIYQSNNQSINQSNNHTNNQTDKQSNNQTIKQSNNQTNNQKINQ